MFIYKIILFSIFGFTPLFSLNILQIAPGWSGSHILFNYRIAKMLADRGHNVTILVHMMTMGVSLKGAPEGVEVIKFTPDVPEEVTKGTSGTWQNLAFQDMDFNGVRKMTEYMRQLIFATAEQILNDHELIDNLRTKHFDITLSHFFSNFPAALSHRLGIEKFIWIATGAFIFEPIAWKMALPHLSSYMPNHIQREASDKMNFRQRLKNTMWSSLMGFALFQERYSFLFKDSENAIVHQAPYQDDPDLYTLSQQTATIMINGEAFLDFPKPILPGMVYLGDLEVKTNVRTLPETWQKLVQESKKGIILFSFGTVANTTQMPLALKEAFFKAFVKFFDYTILWRLEGELPAGLQDYPHIHLVKWMPQSDLLYNKQTKLFITHGGYNSLLESTKAGVPMILMPLLIDQYSNAHRAKKHGLGVILDKYEATSQSIEDAMRLILTNSTYTQNAHKFALILKDQIIANELSAVHQIEKIAKGNRYWPIMKAARRLSWIEYFCLDVVLVGLILIFISLYSLVRICRFVWGYIKN